MASDLFAPSRNTQANSHIQETVKWEPSTLNEDNIKSLTHEEFYQMLQDNPHFSQDQLKDLWRLVTTPEVNKLVKVLLYDYISFEYPDYLINEIIAQAKKENGEPKHKLLVVLQAIYQKKLEKNDKKDLKQIINYFKELQLQDLDKNDGGIVFRGLATLAPKELKIDKANLTQMDKVHVNIFSFNNNRSNEIKYINNIIYNLDHPDDRLFITAS